MNVPPPAESFVEGAPLRISGRQAGAPLNQVAALRPDQAEAATLKRRNLRLGLTAIRWGLGLLLLVLALRQVDIAALAASLRATHVGWLLLTLSTVLLGIALKAVRWGMLLKPVCPEKTPWEILGALLSGQAANILLPFRGGEVIRAGAVVPPTDGRAGAVLVGIGVEKALDFLALSLAAALLVPLMPAGLASSAWARALAAGMALLGAVLAVVLLSRRAWQHARSLASALPVAPRHRVQRWLESASLSLERFVESGNRGKVIALTAVIWLVMLSTNLALLWALGLEAGPGPAALVLIAVHLSLIPALMPGNLGPFYVAVELGLSPFGVPLEIAALYAILLHALVTLPPLAGAGLYLIAARGRSSRE
jgi:uncharacterized membrane protein YbhN (UPF0104 family)